MRATNSPGRWQFGKAIDRLIPSDDSEGLLAVLAGVVLTAFVASLLAYALPY